jgi:hypothetical protein
LTVIQMHALQVFETDNALEVVHRFLICLLRPKVVPCCEGMTYDQKGDQISLIVKMIVEYIHVSMQTPTRSLFSTCSMISANSSNLEPRTLPAPAYYRNEKTARPQSPEICREKYSKPTMFSMTQMTFSVSLCALLIDSATFFRASDFVQAPTVDPGLHIETRKRPDNKYKRYRQIL